MKCKKRHYLYLNILIFNLIFISNLQAQTKYQFWEGTVNGNKISIDNKGITKNGKFTAAFRLRDDELCIYGNTNFPDSPANYRLTTNTTLKYSQSWSRSWGQSLHQKFGFTIDEKHKCENVWKRFIKTANIKLDEDSIKKDNSGNNIKISQLGGPDSLEVNILEGILKYNEVPSSPKAKVSWNKLLSR